MSRRRLPKERAVFKQWRLAGLTVAFLLVAWWIIHANYYWFCPPCVSTGACPGGCHKGYEAWTYLTLLFPLWTLWLLLSSLKKFKVIA